jgi:hypothetical protein
MGYMEDLSVSVTASKRKKKALKPFPGKILKQWNDKKLLRLYNKHV